MEPGGALVNMKKNDFSWRPVVLAILSIFAVCGIYIAYYFFLYSGYSNSVDKDGALMGVRAGTFGDAFGTLNALFSGLAFSGFLITLLMQRSDISDSQVENSKRQVEAQFYNVLKLQQSVVAEFDLQRTQMHAMTNHSVQIVTRGRDCFQTWLKILNRSYVNALSSTREDRLREAYRELWDKHRGDLSLYFRSLYSLFKFISKSEHADKKVLGGIARSFISDYELVVLFYNCLMPNGEKFNEYACEFAVFDNLDVSLLLDVEDVLRMKIEAFGDNSEAIKIFQTSKTMQ